MALRDYQITDADIAAKGMTAAPDQLTGTAAENKKIFDRLVREVVKERHNGLIAALAALGAEQLVQYGSESIRHIRLNADGQIEASTDGKTWAATASSGHLIYDKDGKQLPQRSRLRFTNSTVSDDGTYTVVQGIKGDKGEPGVKGDKGDPCSPNLLRNWYFGRPVNQRGVSGTVSTAGYFLDGWKLVSGSVIIGSDGITLNGTMTQVLEDTPGGTVTASALTAAGSVSEVVPTYSSANKTLTVTASGKKLLAVKLELGDTQTLAHQDTSGKWVLNEIPDFGEQLSRCQRYLIKLESDLVPATIIGSTTILFFVPLPVTMRAAPTLVTNNFRVRATSGGTDQTGFTFSVSAIRSNGVQISAAKTSHGLTGASLNAGADGSLLSAEL